MPETDVQEEVVERAPRGIKKRDIDKEAERLADKARLPKLPRKTDGMQWREYAKLLTPEMWSKLSMYIYRSFPNIIRQLSDPKNQNNIGIVTDIVDIEGYLREMCGGGRFRVDVHDGVEKITEIRVSIPIHECDPKLDYRELDLFSRENQSYIQSLKFRGILDTDGKVLKSGPGTPAGQGNSGVNVQEVLATVTSMQDKMVQMMQKMTDAQMAELKDRLKERTAEQGGLGNAIGQLLLERMKQDDPKQTMQGFSGLLSAAKDLMLPKADNSNVELFKQMLTMQATNFTEMMHLVKEMKSNPSKGENMLENVEAAIGIAERLRDLGGGGPRDTASTVLDYVKELGIPLLQYGTRIYEIAKLGKGVTPAPNLRTGATVTPGAKALTPSQIISQKAREMQKGKVEVQEPEIVPSVPEASMSEDDMALVQIMSQYGGFFVKFLNEGKDGVDLALALIELQGAAVHAKFAAFGADRLMDACRVIPELWKDLSQFGEQNVRTFADEFCNYKDYMVDDEQPEEKQESKKKGRMK